jgi:hypothetical protein
MKKLLFLSTLALGLLVCFSSQAQTEQGKILVGANSELAFMSTSLDGVDDNFTQFNGAVDFGYFFIDNLVFGAILGYESQKCDEFNIDYSAFTYGLQGRYYYENFFVAAAYVSQKEKDEDAVNDARFGVGYAFFINDFISVEPMVFYSLGLGDNKNNTFGGRIGFAIYI